MKKKVFTVIVLSVILLTGCSDNPNILLPYHSEGTHQMLSGDSDIYELSPFTKDVCAYTKNRNKAVVSSPDIALAINISKNKLLFEKNSYQRVYPASITKLMTALVALKYGNLSDTVTISSTALHLTETGAVKCGFQEGDKVSLETLLYSMIVYSGNDAAIAIAEHIGKTEENFVSMMNQEVLSLGCTHTHFVNPHGLHDDNHYTTAYDVYLIFNELLKNKAYKSAITSMIQIPNYEAVYKDSNGTEKKLHFINTNPYLTSSQSVPEGVIIIGGKTGTTTNAGSCLAMYSKDAEKDDYLCFIFHSANKGSLLYEMNTLLGMTVNK